MVQPTARLMARLRFTTKQVAKGFYRGTGSGAMGAHTEYGKYVIDWRKTRHYNVPDLEDFKLTPFVSLNVAKSDGERRTYSDGSPVYNDGSSGLQYLREWRAENKQEYEMRREAEEASRLQEEELANSGQQSRNASS